MNKYLKLYESHSQYVNPEIKPNVSYCKEENEVHYNPRTWADEYFTIESLEDNNTIYLKASSTAFTKTVSASTDNGETWTEYTSSTGGTTLAMLNKGDKLLVKGESSAYATSITVYNQFNTTGQFKVNGNIMSLVSGDSFANADELTGTYTFCRLFYQCTGLTSTENLVLPATTLTERCYSSMFSGCASLTTAPELSATTLAPSCYNSMFYGCTSLTTAPELPATTLVSNCYFGMFFGCTSLTVAPELTATTLAQSCYASMFKDCTSLITAPKLSATTLAESCYSYMFQNCTNLTTAPELPATTLAEYCYGNMFQGCTSLTTAPELPATTLANYCYKYMFSGCTNLNSITCLATNISATNCTNNWVSGVAASGTFVKNAAATWNVTGVNGIPTGWTVQTASE